MSPPILVERTLARVHAALDAMLAVTLIVLVLIGIPAHGLIDATWVEAGRARAMDREVAEAQRRVELAELERQRILEDETACPGDPDRRRRTR